MSLPTASSKSKSRRSESPPCEYSSSNSMDSGQKCDLFSGETNSVVSYRASDRCGSKAIAHGRAPREGPLRPYRVDAEWVLARNYKPGFRMDLHIKDLQNALDTAHELGVPVPLTGQIMEMMQALRLDGKRKDDHGGVIQFYERLAGVKVRAGRSPA